MRTTPRVAGFRSEYPAGFELECMAGFVGIRSWIAWKHALSEQRARCIGDGSAPTLRATQLDEREINIWGI